MTKQTLFLRLLLIVFIGSILGSCGHSNNVVSSGLIQKRKHNKGWFVKSGGGRADASVSNESDRTKERDWDAIISKGNKERIAEVQDAQGDQDSSVSDDQAESVEDDENQEIDDDIAENAVEQQIDSQESETKTPKAIEIPGYPVMPQIRPYDEVLDPILVLGTSTILVVLLLLLFLVALEETAFIIITILAFSFAIYFLISFVRLVAGVVNYGTNTQLELFALIVGGVLGLGAIAVGVYALFNLI